MGIGGVHRNEGKAVAPEVERGGRSVQLAYFLLLFAPLNIKEWKSLTPINQSINPSSPHARETE